MHGLKGRVGIGLVCLAWLTGCSSWQGGGPKARDGELWGRYFAAVAAAKYPDATKISRDLQPILRSNANVRWNADQTHVLMVTWAKMQFFSDKRPGQSFQLATDSWFSLVPEIQVFCQGYPGADLEMRLRQRLGLPPDSENDAFVEVWVDPSDLFRPCPDPEITDSECQTEIPGAAPTPRASAMDQPPWTCPPGDGMQMSGAFVAVSKAHLEWMCNTWDFSYRKETKYPWTALGYSYDWGTVTDHRGVSEYVGPKKATVEFKALIPTREYCGKPH